MRRPVTDAKEVGLGKAAEENDRHQTMSSMQTCKALPIFLDKSMPIDA